MKVFVGIITLLLLLTGCKYKTDESNNMVDQSKIPWSVRMANTVMKEHPSLVYYDRPKGKEKWQYDVAMLGGAIDKLGSINEKYSQYLKSYMNYFVDSAGNVPLYKASDFSLDNIEPAKNLITLYKRTGDDRYMKALKLFIDQLKHQPKTRAGGFWHKKVYPSQMWLDGIYMAAPFMAQYAKEFDKPEWYNEATQQVLIMYHKALDPSTGLLYHGWDESKTQKWCNPKTGCSKIFWGRAMGWYTMSLVDILDYLPENYPGRDSILMILNKTAAALLKVRDHDTGLWYQVLDQGGREGNYLEASCSCMFTYVFAKGADQKYLPEKYYDIARKTFNSIVDHFIKVGPNGLLTLKQVCSGCGLGGDPYRDGSYKYYISVKRVDNDPKGVAPFIMAAIELRH